MCTASFVLSKRVRAAFGPGRIGSRLRIFASAGGTLCSAATRNASPSHRYSVPNLAPQMRVAFSSIASKTRSSTPGDVEMTLNTSDVAVCCSNASLRSSVRWRSSLSSRVFSMAITA